MSRTKVVTDATDADVNPNRSYRPPLWDPRDHGVRQGNFATVTGTPAPDDAVERILKALPEAVALDTLVRACDGAADAYGEVSPLSNHLCGKVAADRPSYHPHPGDVPPWPDALTRFVCDLENGEPIRRNPDLPLPTPLCIQVPGISDGCIARPPPNSYDDQIAVQESIYSGDPNTVGVLDGRLACLMVLADRARAAGGGKLSTSVQDAIRLLSKSLLGNTRWSIPSGWERSHPWPPHYRFGFSACRAHTFLMNPEVEARVIERLLNGAG
jgi:hypothetical protein